MFSPSSDSHVPFQRIGRSQSIRSADDHENRASSSKTGRLLGKLKVGSGSKRKQASVGSPAPSRTSSNEGGVSPFRLAQRLRTLLDAHPVNSPAPSFQHLPTPETSPSPPSVPRSFQQSEPFPTLNQTPESLVSSPATFFSAPSSPADAELAALLSSPILPGGALPSSFDFPPSDTPTTPVAGPSTIVYQPHTPTPSSPGRHETVFNILDRIGSPKARARRLSRVTVDGSPSRDRRESLNASPRAWPVSPAMSSISSVLDSGSVAAAYGSDGMRSIEEETSDDEDDDDTSIMMYSPLMPTSTSLVAIAESEISVIAVHEESDGDEDVEPVQNTPPPPPASEPQPPEQTQSSGWGLGKLWRPFSSWFSSTSPTSSSTQPNATSNANPVEPPTTPRVQQSTAPSPRPTSTQVRLRRRRVWVPSRTQLSLETTWWGYRIYIPPPVLDALDSTSIETTRRAALLTAALTWFFTNLPVNVLPIAVRPVIVILQGLVPYLGYLGSILSWSWGTIRSYDEGYGIILSATWLMPIALIPNTWVPPPSEWPGSPFSIASTTVTQSSPAPSTLSPSSLSTLSPTISQSTSPPPSSSPTLSQSTMTPMPTRSLPLQQEQSPEPPQGQLYAVYSPAYAPLSPGSPAPSLPLTQEYTLEPLDHAQRQSQPYPVYSPYGYTMLSPLSQLSASFPSPVMNPSSYGYTYGHPFPTTSQTSPVMAMSMISPIPANGAVIYSPTMTPLPASSSPYVAPSVASTPSSASALPLASTPSMSQRRARNRNGSLYAPRMTTVPLPDDDR